MIFSVNRDRNPEFILLSFVLHAVFVFFLIRHNVEEPRSVAISLGITFETEQKEQVNTPAPKQIEKIAPQKPNLIKQEIKHTESKNIIPVEAAPQKPEAASITKVESTPQRADTAPMEPRIEKEIPASFTADYLKNPHPPYPSISRRLGEEGKVLLKVQVLSDGTAGAVTVQKGSGFERLDESAINSVKNWRFVPAKKGSQSISSWVVVPIVFSLSR